MAFHSSPSSDVTNVSNSLPTKISECQFCLLSHQVAAILFTGALVFGSGSQEEDGNIQQVLYVLLHARSKRRVFVG